MNTENHRHIEFGQGPSIGLDHSLLTYQELYLIHYLILGLNLHLYLCLSPYPYPYLYLYLVLIDKQQIMDELKVWDCLSNLHQNHKKEDLTWRMKKQNKNYFIQSEKQQKYSVVVRRQCPGLSIKESFRRYALDDVYGSLNRVFWTGLRPKHDIIGGAWSRCYLIQEKAYATL